MLYIIALILLASFVSMTFYIGYSTNRRDASITLENAKNKIRNA